MKVVTGVGTTGSAPVRRNDVSRMGFVGPAETGCVVAHEAVEKFKGATSELGDGNPIVIIPDAGPKTAAATLRPVGGGHAERASMAPSPRSVVPGTSVA